MLLRQKSTDIFFQILAVLAVAVFLAGCTANQAGKPDSPSLIDTNPGIPGIEQILEDNDISIGSDGPIAVGTPDGKFNCESLVAEGGKQHCRPAAFNRATGQILSCDCCETMFNDNNEKVRVASNCSRFDLAPIKPTDKKEAM